MPTIKQYTRQQMPGQFVANRAATGADFGGDQGAVMNNARQLGAMGDQLNAIAGKIQAAEEKRQSREDIIASVRARNQFKELAQNEMARVMAEEDLVDSNTPLAYKKNLQGIYEGIIGNFTGSEDARARLTAELETEVYSMSSNMAKQSINAQRKMVMIEANDRLDPLIMAARQQPENVYDLINEAIGLSKEYQNSFYTEDEVIFKNGALSAIATNAVEGLIEKGRFEEANEMLGGSAVIAQSIDPGKQRILYKQIDDGIAEKTEIIDSINQKVMELDYLEQKLGHKFSQSYRQKKLMGEIDPETKVAEVAADLGKNVSDLTPEQIVSIKYDGKYDEALGGKKIDHNKEYDENGNLTTKGINTRIMPIKKKAEAMKANFDVVKLSVDEFRRTGNKAAVISAITGFKKVLDPNSAVMEGEIRMQAEADGWSAIAEKFINKGQAVGSEQIEEMMSITQQMYDKYISEQKLKIDPYIQRADQDGMDRIAVGMPKEEYQAVFGTELVGDLQKEAVPPNGIQDLSIEELKKLRNEMQK